jgi:hypothetical protein
VLRRYKKQNPHQVCRIYAIGIIIILTLCATEKLLEILLKMYIQMVQFLKAFCVCCVNQRLVEETSCIYICVMVCLSTCMVQTKSD